MTDRVDIAKDKGGGIPPRNFEVQFESAVKRRRGAPLGNRNRLKHGAFSKAGASHRAAIMALVARAERLIVRVGMVARARKALKARQQRTVPTPNPPVAIVLRILAAARALHESWLTRLAARGPPLAPGSC
jgi:hypothetical protein